MAIAPNPLALELLPTAIAACCEATAFLPVATALSAVACAPGPTAVEFAPDAVVSCVPLLEPMAKELDAVVATFAPLPIAIEFTASALELLPTATASVLVAFAVSPTAVADTPVA